MTPEVKICGVTTEATLDLLAELDVDYVGLVLVRKSPRHVTLQRAQQLADHATHLGLKPVALVCNAPADAARLIAETLPLHALQLHGDETPEAVAALHLPGGVRVWKALPFARHTADPWRHRPAVRTLLLDAPPRDGLTGGTGHAFDWAGLQHLDRTGLPPLALAGGLNPDNVAEAVRVARPDLVDVSSGVEQTRGVKDPRRLRAFVAAARAVSSASAARETPPPRTPR